MIASMLLVTAAVAVPARSDATLRGLDPVRLCEGTEVAGVPGLTAARGRFTYRFADAETRDRFLADPERWGIQWGGGCGAMGPLSGAGSPDRFAVHDGRIWIFASDGCRDGFLARSERFVPEPSALPAASDEARRAGEAWIERAVAAHGGAVVVDGAGALRLVSDGVSTGWTSRIELVVASGGALARRTTWKSAEGEVWDTRWIVAGESFVERDGGVLALTNPDQLADLRRFAHREALVHLWARGSEDFVAIHVGAGEQDGAPVERVLVHHAGLTTTLHLEPGSGRIVGTAWTGRVTDGMTRDVVDAFVDEREAGGALLPYGRAVRVDGEAIDELTVAWGTVEVLAEPPPGAFERRVE
jgi:hypothetical protein